MTLNTEITKTSDTRRDPNLIKEAVINVFGFLFSSLTTSHTNLCDHDIKKIQTTEVFTGNSEYIDIDIRKRKIDVKIVKEAAIKVGDSLHHDQDQLIKLAETQLRHWRE